MLLSWSVAVVVVDDAMLLLLLLLDRRSCGDGTIRRPGGPVVGPLFVAKRRRVTTNPSEGRNEKHNVVVTTTLKRDNEGTNRDRPLSPTGLIAASSVLVGV